MDFLNYLNDGFTLSSSLIDMQDYCIQKYAELLYIDKPQS